MAQVSQIESLNQLPTRDFTEGALDLDILPFSSSGHIVHVLLFTQLIER